MGVPGYNEPPFKYANITTDTTTTLKTGIGVLHCITVNTGARPKPSRADQARITLTYRHSKP